jgi:hypothetical protein
MANECELLEGINLESGFRSLPRSGLVQHLIFWSSTKRLHGQLPIVAVALGAFSYYWFWGLVFRWRNLTAAEYTFARIGLALTVACVAAPLDRLSECVAVRIIVYLLAPRRIVRNCGMGGHSRNVAQPKGCERGPSVGECGRCCDLFECGQGTAAAIPKGS